MTRRKSNKKKNFNNEITGIVLISIGLLVLINVFSSSSGMLGDLINKLLFSLVGIGAYLFPFIIIFSGINFIFNGGVNILNKKIYSILTLCINTLLFIQMLSINDYYNNDFMDGLKNLVYSRDYFNGGIVGYVIDVPIYNLLGKVGSIIVFLAIYIICFILIFNLSLYDLGIRFKTKINNRPSKFKTPKLSENNMQVANPIAIDINKNDAERTDFIKGIDNKIKILDFMKNSSLLEEDEPKININSPYEKNEKNNKLENDVKESVNEEISSKIIEKHENLACEYIHPDVDLLNLNTSLKLNKDDKKELLSSASKLEETLASFGVEAKVLEVTKGPSVTRYELQPNAGVKVSKIVNLSDDIALSLASSGVRIEAPIPGKSAVGIEVPNKDLMPVFLREVIESEEFMNSSKNLAFSLGKDIAGNCVVSDLTKMPHLLIAGATGSGKSVCINTLIVSLLYKYSPEDVKLLMIDPKVVELNVYNGIPHLLIPVVTDPKKAAAALNWAVNEMTRRYKLFADNGVRNIESFNELYKKNKIEEKLPWIVMIVDELADLMMVCPRDIEDYIGRLAQMARAAGMHLVIATQRPSVDVITGVIKANIPSRISFAVSSQVDSRTILDSAGAEKLLGKGDMLFYPVGESKPLRIQGAFISEEEVERIVSSIKDQQNKDESYEQELLEHINIQSSETTAEDKDELLDEAIKIVVECGQASTSLLQRRLRIGYNRASRIMDQLEERRIISPKDGSKPRQILIEKDDID